MDLKLPDFTFVPLESLSLCGIIASTDADIPSEELVIETKIEDFADRPAWMRLIINPQKEPDGTHLHLDVCVESAFSKIPTASGNRKDIYDALEVYKGKLIDATVRSAFAIASTQIPEYGIISLFSKIKPNDDVRLTGGTFSIKKGPIDFVRWELDEGDGSDNLNVYIRSVFSGSINSEYALKCYEPIGRAFRSLVLEKEGD
ncbi:MAG: hypothetical protein WD669_07445 [Pirellulales bacterium]